MRQWSVRVTPESFEILESAGSPEERLVCSYRADPQAKPEDNVRDARLIACAPELLEMCRAALSYCEDDSRSQRRRQAMIREARTLLAIVGVNPVTGKEES